MLVIPPKHYAIIPNLKSNRLAYRALPFYVTTLYERHYSDSHWHDYTQIWYTVSGSYVHTINGERQTHTAGSLALIFPYTIHSVDTSLSDLENLRVIRISIFEDLHSKNIMPFRPISYNSSVFDKFILSPTIALSGKEKEQTDVLFEDILSEFNRHYEMNKNAIFLNISKTFELLIKKSDKTINPQKLIRAYEQYELIYEVTDLISKNYGQNISLPQLAEHAFMSKTSFSNKFKDCTGQNFLAFYNKVKMARAIRLLQLTNKTLPEIAEECGFYDSAHLSHAMKRALGVPPLVLKAQMLDHSQTYGEHNIKRSLNEIAWLKLLSEEEKEQYYKLAAGIID